MEWGDNMIYVYVDHLSNSFYGSEVEYDDDELYCESCGDCDYLFGEYESWEDFVEKEVNSILINLGNELNEVFAPRMLLEYDGTRIKVIEEVADE